MPLKRVSPSRFQNLRKCVLRELWTASKEPPLLPLSPFAVIGSVVHQLLATAGNGTLPADDDQFVQQTWDDLIRATEQRLGSSPLQSCLLPLSKSVPDLAVRKARACQSAAEIVRQRGQFASAIQTGQTEAHIGFEIWIESRDGLLGGFVDEVQETESGVVLRDFKTGQIDDDALLAFEVQLKLYASLYNDRFGLWPESLEVLPLRGSPIVIPFTRAECELLKEEGRAFVKSINNKILKLSESPDELHRIFATPEPSVCRLCTFRPGCESYRKRPVSGELEWPLDFWGRITRIQKLGNGTVHICVKVEPPNSSEVHVRGIDPSRVEQYSVGDGISIFNLRRTTLPGHFLSTPTTTIYSE